MDPQLKAELSEELTEFLLTLICRRDARIRADTRLVPRGTGDPSSPSLKEATAVTTVVPLEDLSVGSIQHEPESGNPFGEEAEQRS
jgi:hypothetical protein